MPYLSLRHAGSISETDKEFAASHIQDLAYSFGLDMKYTLDNNTAMDFTFNPDFGQVEADRVIVNFSAYETFFPEKRPFFLEGMNLFNTPYQLFYSRRIGRAPQMSPEIPEGGRLLESSGNTTIIGAGKITGRLRDGTQYAIIESITQEENALVQDSLGVKSRFRTEPQALYQAGRIKKDFSRDFSMGFLGTALNREKSSDAFSGGLDFDSKIQNGHYGINGQLISSYTHEEGTGRGLKLNFNKLMDNPWSGGIGYHYNEPGLNLNSMGFFNQSNRHGFNTQLGYTYRPESTKIFTKINLGLESGQDWNFDGRHVGNFYGLRAGYDGNTIWQFGGINFSRKRIDDKGSFGGPLLIVEPDIHYWSWIGSNSKNKISLTSKTGYTPQTKTLYSYYIAEEVTFRPFSRFEISTEIAYNYVNRKKQWVDQTEDASGQRVDISGNLISKSYDLTTRWILLLNPNLSLQFYNQLFLGKGIYRGFERVTGPGQFSSLGSLEYSNNLDYQRDVSNVSLLLRWEYMPGSVFYAGWTQNLENSSWQEGASFENRLRNLGRADADNSFIIKFDYRSFL